MNKEQEIFVGNLLKELGPDQLQDDSENLFLRDSGVVSWSEFIEEADRLGHTTLAKEMSKAEAAYFWSE